jgi:hypothetical protein
MGTDIDNEEFGERDYSRFAERLGECLSVLGQLLNRPGFGAGRATMGAELELFLIDDAGRPLPHNQAIRAAVADPRVTVELNRFNLELNASPALLAGRPFAALGGELNLLVNRVANAARNHGGRVAVIGILPTLRPADLGPAMMTDVPRYRALNRGLQRLRQDPFHIQIAGEDPLELASHDVGLEAANTSFQVHLRVDPADFTRTYNAVQLATAPVLAGSGNSPTFLGHRLWEETRIAVFKQSVDDRHSHGPRRRPARTALGTSWLRGGALELFTESIRLHQPLLPALGHRGPIADGAGAGAAAGRAQAAPGHRVALEPGHLRPLFTTPLADQEVKFAAKLTEIVRAIPRLDDLLTHTRALGARHASYGVRAADYQTLGDALLAALAATSATASTTARARHGPSPTTLSPKPCSKAPPRPGPSAANHRPHHGAAAPARAGQSAHSGTRLRRSPEPRVFGARRCAGGGDRAIGVARRDLARSPRLAQR